MYEQRDPELLPSSSSAKPAVVVAGVVVGLSLLICGGAAGYVAFTDLQRVQEPAEPASEIPKPDPIEEMRKRHEQQRTANDVPFTDDPIVVRKIAARIVDIDLPADFEPIEASREQKNCTAVFGRKSASEALLKLGAMNNRGVPHEGGVANYLARTFDMIEMENGRTDTTLEATRKEMKSVKRELIVLGQKTVFKFLQGTRRLDNKPVWKIWGTFSIPTGTAALIYMVPEQEFDEEAAVRMIESIRPAPDEAVTK